VSTGRGMTRAVVMALAAGLVVGGCGTTTSGLDVRYPESGINRAMLATVAPRRVELSPVADRRPDPARIGADAKTGKDIVTARPVTDIVRDALALELGKNGHVVVAGARDVAVTATVEEFWLDAVVGYTSTQYVGKVALALAVTNGRTGESVVARHYVGVKRRATETAAPAETVEREVMDAALARVMHDVATDPELVRALAAVPAAR
jgi:Uncharacterized lipoprotein